MARNHSQEDAVRDRCFELLKATSLYDGRRKHHTFLGKVYGSNLLMLQWDHDPMVAAAGALVKLIPSISEKAATTELRSLIVRCFEATYVDENADPDTPADCIESLGVEIRESGLVESEIALAVDNLRAKIQDWQAFVFMEGLEVTTPCEIGSLTLYDRRTGPLAEALEREEHTRLRDHLAERLPAIEEHCHCYAVIEVQGETNHACQMATRAAANAANLLSLYLVPAWPRHLTFRDIGTIGHLRGPVCSLVILCATRSQDGRSRLKNSVSNNAEGLQYYLLSPKDISDLPELGVEELASSLETVYDTSAAPTASAQRMASAVTWYGRATRAPSLPEAYICLATALESLLYSEDKESIAQGLADRVAGLLGTTHEDRMGVARRVKRLYAVRSRLVHSGISPSEVDVQWLFLTVRYAIIEFARRETPAIASQQTEVQYPSKQ